MFGFGVGIQRLGSFGVDTKASLLALDTPASGLRPTGFVYADPDPAKNGVYIWTGSAWTRERGLPEQIASLTVTGGTANAIVATAQDGVDLSQIVVCLLTPTADNTGAVTLNGKNVVDSDGAALTAGAIVAGKTYLLADRGSEFRVILNEFASISDVVGLQDALDEKATPDDVALAISIHKAQELVHKLVNTQNLGYGTGSPLPASNGAPQGFCHLVVGGQRKAFVSANETGSVFATNERARIFEFNLTDDGTSIVPVSYSQQLNIGHAQDLKGEVVGGTVFLWTTSPTVNAGVGAGKGFSRIEWKGSATAQADVQTFLVFGAAGSGHSREQYYQGTVGLSNDGKVLTIIADSGMLSQGRFYFEFDKAAIMAAASSLTVEPLASWPLAHPKHTNGRILQGSAADDRLLYTLSGYHNALGISTIQVFNRKTGDLLDEFQICPEQERIGIAELMGSATYTSYWIEPEGIDIYGDELLVQYLVLAHTGGSIVSLNGKNYAYIGNTPESGHYPYETDYFQLTNLAATAGAWDVGTTYTRGSAPVHIKSIWSIRPPEGVSGETPIAPLKYSAMPGSAATLSNTVWHALQRGVLQYVTKFSETIRDHMRLIGFSDNGLRLHDARIGSDNAKFGTVSVEFDGSNASLLLRAMAGLAEGAGITIYGKDSSFAPGQVRIHGVEADGTIRTIYLRPQTSAVYGDAGAFSLGLSTHPFNNVVSNKMMVVDGVSAPSTVSGMAQIYVDAADGDLKVKFGDGTVKTIVVDT